MTSPPDIPRRRRGRGSAVLLVLALAAGAVWWNQSEDPRGELAGLTDPTTYADLVDRANELFGDGLVVPDRSVVPVPLPDVDVAGPTGAPPPGQGESATRLAPPVEVARPSSAYRFAALQDDGVSPVAWSPCRPISYVVNPDGAPDGFEEAVREAMAELATLTGLVIVEEGTTTESPSPSRPAYQPEAYGERWAPVLVAITDAATVPHLDGDVAGVAYTYRVRGSAGGEWVLTSGAVYLDADALGAGRGPEPSWVVVLRHELGHLAGLDHVDDTSQLMNPVTSTIRTYQDGDRTGLAELGRGACAPNV